MRLQLKDRLIELPYRFRPAARAGEPTWPVTDALRERIAFTWPARYGNPPANDVVQTVKHGLSRLGVLRLAHTRQTLGPVRMDCKVDGRSHSVGFDYSDYHNHIDRDVLAECSLYFKGQFRHEGYDDPRIVPGGYITAGVDYYRYYRHFLDRYSRERSIDVAGRFGYRFQPDFRRKAVESLNAASDIRFVGTGPKVRYSRFLREVASARLSLHLPGNGPFTYRVAEFLGLGSCMVALRFPTQLHVPLVAGTHYVVIADDLSDLVETCRYYLAHDSEREAIARAGREFFERYLHCEQLASYFVHTIIDRLAT